MVARKHILDIPTGPETRTGRFFPFAAFLPSRVDTGTDGAAQRTQEDFTKPVARCGMLGVPATADIKELRVLTNTSIIFLLANFQNTIVGPHILSLALLRFRDNESEQFRQVLNAPLRLPIHPFPSPALT